MLRAFANLKISAKTMLGFLCVIALLVAVAGLGVRGLDKMSNTFSAYSAVSGNALRVTTIDRDLTGLRRNAALFADSGDERIATRFRDAVPAIKKTAEEAYPLFSSDERRSQLRDVIGKIDAYTANFENLVKLRAQREALVNDKLNPLGLKGRQSLTEVTKSAMADKDMEAAALVGLASVELMQVRLNANRFLDNRDPKLAEATRNYIASFGRANSELLQRLQNPSRRQQTQAAGEAMEQYGAAFETVFYAVTETDKMLNVTMAEQAVAAAQALAALRTAQLAALTQMTADAQAAEAATMTMTLAISAGAILIGLVLAWLIGRGISRPVLGMTSAMQQLAGGDTRTVIPAQDRKDEIGVMAAAVQIFKDNMIEADRLRAESEEQKKRAEIEKKAAMNKMADEFESSVKGVVQIVSSASTELQSTAQSMSATAEETQRQSTAVAAASEQASTNVQTVASAAEELSSSITEISRQVSESTRIAGQAVSDAERTNTEIQGLSEAAQKIGDVVKLINDIAGQTNLLALNATIEAARAGEAGKGFAVVASEVKNLASQTAKATEEISAKIAEMQAATGRSVTAVQGIGQTIGRINEIATTIASAVEEQGAATQEIARNVQQASAGTAEVSSNIVGVTKAANDTGAASTQVLGSAGELSKQSETLRQQVDSFIARIRAA